MLIFSTSLLLISVVTVLMVLRGVRVFLQPARRPYRKTPAALGLLAEEVRLRSDDGVALAAWFVRPTSSASGAALLMFHGLGSNRSDLLVQASSLARAGYYVLLTDFRGHGQSEGSLSTLGVQEVQDVTAAYHYLIARPEVDPQRVGVVAHSMGAATTLCAAAQLPGIKAVVLQAAFATLEENVTRALQLKLGAASLVFRPVFNQVFRLRTGASFASVRPIDGLAQLSASALLLVHGDADGFVILENSRRLYDAFTGSKQLLHIKGACHRSILHRAYPLFELELLSFLADHLQHPVVVLADSLPTATLNLYLNLYLNATVLRRTPMSLAHVSPLPASVSARPPSSFEALLEVVQHLKAALEAARTPEGLAAQQLPGLEAVLNTAEQHAQACLASSQLASLATVERDAAVSHSRLAAAPKT